MAGTPTTPGGTTILVVPCFDEAARLDADAFSSFLADAPHTRLLFVDDGSTDGTRAVLDRLAEKCGGRASVLVLPENRGKGEAVRMGLLAALDDDPDLVGYWDADLASPLGAVATLAEALAADADLHLVMGSRVRLLGRTIRRHAWRHAIGRVAATAVALALGAPVYDTQCGAKLLRATAELPCLLATPFRTRWLFDVELLARIAAAEAADSPAKVLGRRVREIPLETWTDVGGSHVRLRDALGLPRDLLHVWRQVRGRGSR